MSIKTAFLICALVLTPLLSEAKTSARITAPAGGRFAKGKPIEIKYEVTGAPSSASVVLYLEKAGPPEVAREQPGLDGAIMTSSRALNGSGKGSFTWDGASIANEAGDWAVIEQHPAEPGKYVFRAVVYDKKEVGVGGGPRQASPDDEKVIAEAKSTVFEVFGKPDLTYFESDLELMARVHLKESLDLTEGPDTRLDRFLESGSPLKGPDAKGVYCRDFKYKLPFAGTVTVCGPNRGRTKYMKVRGKPTAAKGTESFQSVSAKAIALAEKPYAKRAAFPSRQALDDAEQKRLREGKAAFKDTTYLDAFVTDWAYFPAGRHWVFVINVMQAGGDGKSKHPSFSDTKFIKVPDKGSVCEVGDISNSDAPDAHPCL